MKVKIKKYHDHANKVFGRAYGDGYEIGFVTVARGEFFFEQYSHASRVHNIRIPRLRAKTVKELEREIRKAYIR